MNQTTVYRRIRYRLLPKTESNWRWLEKTLEDQRFLYNAALEERIGYYRKTGKALSLYDQFGSLTACRQEIEGFSDTASVIQRGTLGRLDEAYQAFFRRVKNGENPGFQNSRVENIGKVSLF